MAHGRISGFLNPVAKLLVNELQEQIAMDAIGILVLFQAVQPLLASSK